MTTAYSTNLELALPVQGELSGTWGNTVNNGITQYLDAAIAGSQIISGSQTAVTLTNTNGDDVASNIAQAGSGATGTAQYQIIRCTGNPASLLTITISDTGVAGYSKTFIILNATSTSQSVKIVGSGPTTGITIASGAKSLVAWNGSDFVEIASSTADGVTTFSAGTTGLTPSTATTGAITLAGTLALTNGGTGATTAPGAMANLTGFTTTATAAGTTTLTNTSSYYQYFTGTTTQTVQLPVTSTLQTGWSFHIVNNSTGIITVNSSGGNAVITVPSGTTTMCTCIATSTTTAADWESGLTDFSTSTGSGSVVLSNNPSLTNFALGTPVSGTLTNATGLPLTTGVTGTLPIANGGTGTTSTTFANLTTNVTGTLPVANGGTGAATFTANNVLLGNGTSAFQVIAPSTVGNVLTSDGTTWQSSTPAAGVSLSAANTWTATQTFNGSSTTLAVVLENAAEYTTVSAIAATGTINFDVLTQSVLYYTSNASANWTLRVRGSSSTSFNTISSVGQTVTVVFMVTTGSTAYYPTSFMVDGDTITPKWQGGTAPTSGNASSIDVYTYAIVKTASATYTVFASQTQFK